MVQRTVRFNSVNVCYNNYRTLGRVRVTNKHAWSVLRAHILWVCDLDSSSRTAPSGGLRDVAETCILYGVLFLHSYCLESVPYGS